MVHLVRLTALKVKITLSTDDNLASLTFARFLILIRLEDTTGEDVWYLCILTVGLRQDLFSEDDLAVLVNNVASTVDKIAHCVDRPTIQVMLVIVAWVLGHIAIKPALDPPHVPLSESEELGRFLEHNLPEVEHDLSFVVDNVAFFVDEVAGRVDESTKHVNCLACPWVRIQNDFLRVVILKELADDVCDFKGLTFVGVE